MSVTEDEYWQVRPYRSQSRQDRCRARNTRNCRCFRAFNQQPQKDVAAAFEIADAGALPYLEKALGDPDPEVRKNVRWAIGRIEVSMIE